MIQCSLLILKQKHNNISMLYFWNLLAFLQLCLQEIIFCLIRSVPKLWPKIVERKAKEEKCGTLTCVCVCVCVCVRERERERGIILTFSSVTGDLSVMCKVSLSSSHFVINCIQLGVMCNFIKDSVAKNSLLYPMIRARGTYL